MYKTLGPKWSSICLYLSGKEWLLARKSVNLCFISSQCVRNRQGKKREEKREEEELASYQGYNFYCKKDLTPTLPFLKSRPHLVLVSQLTNINISLYYLPSRT